MQFPLKFSRTQKKKKKKKRSLFFSLNTDVWLKNVPSGFRFQDGLGHLG